MQWITVATPPFASIEQVDTVVGQLPGTPDGLEARYVGTATDGSLRIISVWESQAHAERFFAEQLGPAIARAFGPELAGKSEVLGVEVARSYVSAPVG
jgi:hypothetical protein